MGNQEYYAKVMTESEQEMMEHEPMEVRNYLQEARLIWAGKSMMLPERAHLEAAFKLVMDLQCEIVDLQDSLIIAERESWHLRIPTGERDSG